jgi:hypothetical protein
MYGASTSPRSIPSWLASPSTWKSCGALKPTSVVVVMSGSTFGSSAKVPKMLPMLSK